MIRPRRAYVNEKGGRIDIYEDGSCRLIPTFRWLSAQDIARSVAAEALWDARKITKVWRLSGRHTDRRKS